MTFAPCTLDDFRECWTVGLVEHQYSRKLSNQLKNKRERWDHVGISKRRV